MLLMSAILMVFTSGKFVKGTLMKLALAVVSQY